MRHPTPDGGHLTLDTLVPIKKFVARAHNLHDLVDLGTLDARAAAFLRASVIARLNIVVCDARTPA